METTIVEMIRMKPPKSVSRSLVQKKRASAATTSNAFLAGVFATKSTIVETAQMKTTTNYVSELYTCFLTGGQRFVFR